MLSYSINAIYLAEFAPNIGLETSISGFAVSFTTPAYYIGKDNRDMVAAM